MPQPLCTGGWPGALLQSWHSIRAHIKHGEQRPSHCMACCEIPLAQAIAPRAAVAAL